MRCFICDGTEDVRYCALCQKWLCARCRRDPSRRVKAALKEWWSALVNPHVSNRLW